MEPDSNINYLERVERHRQQLLKKQRQAKQLLRQDQAMRWIDGRALRDESLAEFFDEQKGAEA